MPYLILVLLSGAVRLYHLGFKSLWFDEAVIYWIAKGSFFELIRENAQVNSAPPLYPLLVNFISRLGSGEATLRSLSWMAGVLGVVVFYVLARQFVSTRAAFFTSILLSLAPFHVEYSQELREYSLTFLLSSLLIYAYARFMKEPGRRQLASLTAIAVVSIFTQYGLVVVLVGLNIHFIFELLRSHSRRTLLLRWVYGQTVNLIAVLAVYLLALRYQFSSTGFSYLEPGYWRGGFSGLLPYVYRQTYDIFLFLFVDPPVYLVGLLIGILVLLANPTARLELSKLLLPFVLAAALGALGLYPYLGGRQTLFLAPFLFLLLAHGIDHIQQVDPKRLIIFSFMLMALRTYVIQTSRSIQFPGMQNMRRLVEVLDAEWSPGDRIFVCPGAVPAFRYYFKGPEDIVAAPAEGVNFQDDLGTILGLEGQAGLEAALGLDGRLWVFSVLQCPDIKPHLESLQERGMVEVKAASNQAALYLRP